MGGESLEPSSLEKLALGALRSTFPSTSAARCLARPAHSSHTHGLPHRLVQLTHLLSPLLRFLSGQARRKPASADGVRCPRRCHVAGARGNCRTTRRRAHWEFLWLHHKIWAPPRCRQWMPTDASPYRYVCRRPPGTPAQRIAGGERRPTQVQHVPCVVGAEFSSVPRKPAGLSVWRVHPTCGHPTRTRSSPSHPPCVCADRQTEFELPGASIYGVLYALLPLTLAYRGAVPAARSRTAAQAQPRLAACMCTGDAAAEARRRWLERTSNSNGGTSWQRQQQGADGDATRSPEDAIIERQREREDARKRMLAMMGGDNEQLRSGLGVQFGYGAPDDTFYRWPRGGGPPRRRRR